MPLPHLVTIPISHYGERARWALDFAELEYVETHHLQMFSWVAAMWLGGKKTLPLLVTDGGVLTESADIVRWAAERSPVPLYPTETRERAAIEEFEQELSNGFAVESRRRAYQWLFEKLDTTIAYNAGRAPIAEVRAMSSMRAFARVFATRYLDVTPAAVARAGDAVGATFDRIAERLSDGRRFLFGDRFTAADLAFAAFAAPCVMPERYPVTLPRPEELGPAAGAAIRSMRRHPAGAFALRLYDERPPPRGRYARNLLVDRVAASRGEAPDRGRSAG